MCKNIRAHYQISAVTQKPNESVNIDASSYCYTELSMEQTHFKSSNERIRMHIGYRTVWLHDC